MMRINKDKKIKIFYLERVRENGNIIVRKIYIHPLTQGLCARYRDISFTENTNLKSEFSSNTAEFIINKRSINSSMYIEYKDYYGKIATYQIFYIDKYLDYNTDIRINAKKVIAPKYDELYETTKGSINLCN